MTLLISDGKTVYADSIEIVGDIKFEVTTTKIQKFDGMVCGIAGVLAYRDVLFEWASKHDCNPAMMPETLSCDDWVLVVFKPDAAYYYTSDLKHPDKYNYPCGFGSAGMYVQVALRCGVPVKKIMDVCCESLSTVDGPVVQLKIPKQKDTPDE